VQSDLASLASPTVETGPCLPRSSPPSSFRGGNVINIVQFAAICAIASGRAEISIEDAMKIVQREFEKEGKVFARLAGGVAGTLP
jgi:hypothetical protein